MGRKFGSIDDLDCVITKTFSGGFHIYCEYDKRLTKTIIKDIEKHIKVGILTDGCCAYEGQNWIYIKIVINY